MQTLWDVLDHYNKGDGIADPWLDKDMQPLVLTEPKIDDVVVFLGLLTSPRYKELGDREHARQLALSKVNRPQRDTERGIRPETEAATTPTALLVWARCIFRRRGSHPPIGLVGSWAGAPVAQTARRSLESDCPRV
jgi:hypothetical protein